MTQRKDVASNPDQAAQDLMVYLLTYRDDSEKHKLQAELNAILMLAQSEYAGESMSYFKQYFVYPVSRVRRNELAEAITSLKGCSEEQFARFIIIVDLLTNGACKSTSLNTIILDKLLAATGKYLPINEDKRLDATGSLSNDARENVREIVKGLFIEKAKVCISKHLEEKRQEDARKLLAARDINVVKPGRVDAKMKMEFVDTLNDFLKGKIKKIGGKSDKPVVSKIKQSELAKKHAVLLAAFGKRLQPAAEKLDKQAVIASSTAKAKLSLDVLKQSPMMLAILAKRQQLEPEEAEKKSPSVQSKSMPGKLSQNESLAASRNAISGFFAKRTDLALNVSTIDEFEAIARRSSIIK